jgi:cytosine/adenosine deaminase-related metal-dependent hydrolase
MFIVNARVAQSANESMRRVVEIRRSRMLFRNIAPSGPALDLAGHLLLPGLINAHDHLEFNLFPRLGTRRYTNVRQWAADIYKVDESPVREHRRVPLATRLFWGGIKNLVAGVTTVSHHNPYQPRIFDSGFPVRVVRRFGWAHSLAFSPDVATRFAMTPARQPFIIHAGEGTDAEAREEVQKLEKSGVLRARTVLVHGIGFDAAGFDLVRRRGASMIWCPSSNLLTYGRTLQYEHVAPDTPIALGTDSAISAAGDMVDEIHVARKLGVASLERLYRMVTDLPARILRLDHAAGALRHGGAADLVVVRDTEQTPAEALIGITPEIVITRGRIHLISKRLLERVPRSLAAGWHSIRVEGRGEWLTPLDVPSFLHNARLALGPEIRLAGRRVTQWQWTR